MFGMYRIDRSYNDGLWYNDEEEEDHMTGYETIILPSPRNSSHFDLGTPLGAPLGPSKNRGHSVVVNNAARSHADARRNTWNTNPRSGIIIQHLNSIPPDATPPRIVEVTGMEDLEQEDGDRRGITNPDYPRSEPDTSGQNNDYPILPMDAGPPLPDRDYSNSDSRPDIHRVNLSAGDNGDPPGLTVIPPSAPPPPPFPKVKISEETSTQPSQENIEPEVPQNQELHIVLRRALARNFDTTQPATDEPDRPQEEGTERVSRESFTQTLHEQQKSAEVQTTLERPSRRDQSKSGERNSADNRNNDNQSGQTRVNDSSSDNRRSSRNRESYDQGQYGPRFQSEDHPSHNNRSSQRPYSGVESDYGRPKRSSRIIERIIITREIDPATGQPLESVPMQNFEQRPPRPRPAHNIAYNNSVRDSGRRSRGWAPFNESHRNWSPREINEHVDLTGIVAGMETGTDSGEQYSYMPHERAERRGRTNQGYDVSPPEDRRRPDVVRVSSGQALGDGHGVPPPPPYTERDVSPPPLRSSAGHGWGRSGRPRSWPAGDSDGSSTIAAGWTQRTRVVFAVMLLLCIILLLGLVVVVSVYFTAGPGKECLSSAACEAPSVGYIAAFGVIGFLALTFMVIGVILCCFACRMSRDKRMQNYPVSAHR